MALVDDLCVREQRVFLDRMQIAMRVLVLIALVAALCLALIAIAVAGYAMFRPSARRALRR